MLFQWEIPNKPPDSAALERMKQHFRQPIELMPVAWFIGKQIDYYTWLAEVPPDALGGNEICKAMNEIAGGIVAFPEVRFVPVWKGWFKYLLPYAIAHANEGAELADFSVLLATLTALISVYQQQIDEEYEGFRDDVIYSLGTRIFSYLTTLDELEFNNVATVLDRYDEPVWLYDDLSLPMLVGLKYLEPPEIESWIASIIGIKNHAWRFAVLFWWLDFHKFLQLAEHWPEDGDMERLLDMKGGLVETFWISRMRFASLDAFVPPSHLATFQTTFAKYLTYEVFQSWAEDITSRRTFDYDSNSRGIPIPPSDLSEFRRVPTAFEREFFH